MTAPPSPYVLVTGHPRSGTTLVAEVLARHPDVYMLPETHFFEHIFSRKREKSGLYHRALRRDFRKTIRNYLAFNTRLRERAEELAPIAELEEFLASRPYQRPTDLFFHILAWFRRRSGRDIVVEKTPAHYTVLPYLVRHGYDFKAINIVRDPRDVVISYRSIPWGDDSEYFVAFRWKWAYFLAKRGEQAVRSAFLQVRYEDMVGSPQWTAKRLTSFLGIPFDKTILQPSNEHRTFDVAREPWKAQSSTEISPDKLARWRRDLDPATVRRIEHLLRPELDRLGYECLFPPPKGWQQLAQHVTATGAMVPVVLRRRFFAS